MKITHSPVANTLSLLACSVLAAAMIALGAGCASTKQTEDLLSAAGFKARHAATAEQQAQLKSLPARKVSTVEKGGKKYYVYPDAAKNIIYVGDSAQYAEYQKLRKEQQWAEEQANPAVQLQEATVWWLD
ncbi:MAG TPA: hypothetical protein VFZ59_05580 [Verrucomicrobiae bacterium]|nr:hypothetical protein [Verrucomicrobiae bacterium]